MNTWELKNMDDLEKVFNRAVEKRTHIGVFIEMPGFDEPELITNPPANVEKKLEYYKVTYDADLCHKYAPGIRIIGYTL